MTFAEWVSILVGGGILWKLLPLAGRYTAEPGPILTLSSVNMTAVQGDPNSVYPRVLQIENIGNKAAFETTWEIREYYPLVPPSFESVCGNRMIPLKPQEHFLLNVVKDGSEADVPGHDDLSVAHFGVYEVLLWYHGPNRVKYLSHVSIWLGDVKQHKAGLNPLQRALYFLRPRMWMVHFRFGLGIQLKLRLRPFMYRLRQWIVRRQIR
jgi:hypothetical protein